MLDIVIYQILGRKGKSSFTFTKWLNLVNHPFPRFLAFLVIIRTVDRFSYIVTAFCVFVFGFYMIFQVVESCCLIITITAGLELLSVSLTKSHTLILGFNMGLHVIQQRCLVITIITRLGYT